MTSERPDSASGPTRFRDPFRPEPWARAAWIVAPGLKRDDQKVERLRKAHFEGDAKADAVVAWMHTVGMKEARRLFERAVEEGVEALGPGAPPALVAFFREVEQVPPWLDRNKLDLACRTSDRCSLGGEYILLSLCLLSGYLSAGVAKTLVRTGSLERAATRRLAETSKFVNDVYGSRTMDRTSAGFKTTVRVRIMHALVRRDLLSQGWDINRWGIPINQADMAATIQQFSTTYGLGLRAIGFRITQEEADALAHLWRYVGTLLGVHAEFLPHTAKEGRALLRLLIASQQGPDEDSRALARALMGVPAEREAQRWSPWRMRAELNFRAGLSRLLMGPSAADALGLPNTPWKYAPLALAPLVFGSDTLRRWVPGATERLERFGRALSEQKVQQWLENRPPTFVPGAQASPRDTRARV